MNDIKVLILAGGDSSRLWPFKDKLFLNFLGLSLIEHTLYQIKKTGLRNIIIVTNIWNHRKFSLLKQKNKELNIVLVKQNNDYGMAGAVVSAENYLKNNRILIVGPSDLYDDKLYNDFSAKLKTHPKGIIAGISHDEYFPGGYIVVNNHLVKGIIEKPKKDKRPGNIIKIIFDYFENTDLFLQSIKEETSPSDDVYEKAIVRMINKGFQLEFLQYNGFWRYLKYPWHILDLTQFFLNKIKSRKGRKVMISPSASLEGEVVIEDGVKILDNVKISGPVYIGKNTTVGNNSFVRQSIIGNGCMVGFSTEIARSYIGNKCWFHNNYIGDSVLADNTSMGAGAVAANYRFDGETIKSNVLNIVIDTEKKKLGAMIGSGARIGVNSSIMPGIKIGSKSIVGSGLVLSEDLQANHYIKLIESKIIKKNIKK